MYVDLSHIIYDGIAVYPGDDPVSLRASRTHENDKHSNYTLSIQMHAGTHIDGPMHLLEKGLPLYLTPIDNFIGKVVLLDVRGEKKIEMKPEYTKMVKKGSIVLVFTGHGEKFGSPDYFESFPELSEQLAIFLVEKQIKLIGMDTPSPDKAPHPVHKLLLGNGIPILENLHNLSMLNPACEYELIALPLPVKSDSAPARVIARKI